MTKKKAQFDGGGYCLDNEFFKMTDNAFIDWCGGRLALALFKGEFREEVYQIVLYSKARGMKAQWEEDHPRKKSK